MMCVVTKKENPTFMNLPETTSNQNNEDSVSKWMESLKVLDPNSWISCIFCTRLFVVSKVIQHVHSDHRASYSCDQCDKTCSSQGRLDIHKRTHTRNRKCELCSKVFKTAAILRYHIKGVHEKKEWFCDICQASFKHRHSLVIHTRTHSDTGKYECNLCGKKYAYSSLVKKHFHSTHATNIKCKVCNEVFQNYYYLQKHSVIHRKPILHSCPICKKDFNAKHKMTKHLKAAHENKKKFACDICEKVCASNTSLRDHKFIHLGIKPFECHDCGKKFNNKNRLRAHVLVHTGLKSHFCSCCDKKFSQRSSLIIHMRGHTGEKPYKCDLCDKAFVSRNLLNIHNKKHD